MRLYICSLVTELIGWGPTQITSKQTLTTYMDHFYYYCFFFRISSMYAEDPDHYLNFRLNESNMLDMLETPYSATLKSLIETQLVGNKSLPAFLSALTLDLFQRTTITMS